MSRLSISEQETTINIMRDDNFAELYTCDQLMITKMDNMVKKSSEYSVKHIEYYPDGSLLSKVYVFPKKLLSFRSAQIKREMTEEQKQRSAEALRKYRESKKDGGSE